MSDAVFGVVTTPTDVEEAVIATIKKWSTTYLQFMGRRAKLGFEAYEPIRSYRAADTLDERFIEQQIPAVQVMLTADAEVYAEPESAVGHFNGMVDVLVAAPEPETARHVSIVYSFAIGLLLVQHKSLDNSVHTEGLNWTHMATPAVGQHGDGRWLAVGSCSIDIAVGKLFNQEVGPLVPTGEAKTEPESIPPDYPTIESETLILQPKGV